MSSTIAASFYKFVALPDYADLRAPLLAHCESEGVKGTILLAAEGVNGTIAGTCRSVQSVLAFLRADARLHDLEHKQASAETMPFYRMKVRLKREIVTLGVPGLQPASSAGTYVPPEQWNALLDTPEVVLIDVRNDYEIALGSFPGAINPHTRSFSELPQLLAQEPRLRGKPKVAMFCTGGIRCEKSTALLRSQGFDEVYHLQGGILKYLESVPPEQSRWQGECFVFDERVSVGPGLAPGHYDLCRSCRNPIGEQEKASPLYVAGVSCPRCHGTRDEVEKRNLLERQRQVELAKRHNRAHIGVRQTGKDPK
jgi:UPF0176 protein